MTGLDTNVLVRYLTQDDQAQSRRANALIEDTVARGDRCFINLIVLCELVWVLRGAYGFDKTEVIAVLEKMLATTQFYIEDRDLVRRALENFATGPGDFPDYLLGSKNAQAGCHKTATFDRTLKRSALFTIL